MCLVTLIQVSDGIYRTRAEAQTRMSYICSAINVCKFQVNKCPILNICQHEFLALLYKPTGRAVALLPMSAFAEGALIKYLNFIIKFLCDRQGVDRRAIQYADRSCLQRD